jgi:uncharacterized protein
VPIRFEWNPRKAGVNQRKHGVSFGEAATIFGDPLALTAADPVHSDREDRFVTMGVSDRGRTLIIVHTDRGDAVRIISARRATRTERRQYEQGT